ncbi:8784_t:CDS:2 [Funneliformis mosseae]|uniref:8784_t:CDS:1 n=1 Tax=Funneliformis mosseae TaxID=27381 RepID=A0A9N9F6Y1_FUNMO|nr:8784_t:CDS:2 [Funneliformis mosseae]
MSLNLKSSLIEMPIKMPVDEISVGMLSELLFLMPSLYFDVSDAGSCGTGSCNTGGAFG